MMMLSEKQLEQFKCTLLQQRLQLQHSLEDNEESAETVVLDQSKVGRLSRMDAMQQQAMAKASIVQNQLHLNQIQRALHAIEEGDYGYCEGCGKDIPLQRLEARPESIYCIECKTKLEAS